MRNANDLGAQELGAVTELKRRVAEGLHGVGTRWTVFGSRARGDADQESDLDLLIELDIECLTFSDKRTIRRLAGEVSLAHGLVLSVLAVDRSAVRERGDFSIFATIKEEGIPL